MKIRLIETSRKGKAKELLLNPINSKIKTFAIMTGENPDAEPATKEQNKKYNNEFKRIIGKQVNRSVKDDNPALAYKTGEQQYTQVDGLQSTLIRGHFPYYKVKGHYGGNAEHSFLIYNLTMTDAQNLASTARQQSFIFGTNDNGKLTFEFWANASKSGYSYKKVDEKQSVVDATNAEDFYTKVAKEYKFNIPFTAFTVEEDDMVEFWDAAKEKAIDESLNENVTGFERLRMRSAAYRKDTD